MRQGGTSFESSAAWFPRSRPRGREPRRRAHKSATLRQEVHRSATCQGTWYLQIR